MTMEFLIVALFAVSLLTNLTVEGIKKLLDKKSVDYSSNVMAAVTAVVISVALSAGYLIYTETMLNAKIGVELIALAYLSFLVATNGYDKVIQAIKQIKQIGTGTGLERRAFLEAGGKKHSLYFDAVEVLDTFISLDVKGEQA